MVRRALVIVALAFLATPGTPASAAGVQLQMANGRVTLHASNATLRQILDEWARVGHTTIVNADKVPGGAPLTFDLEDVPEAEALSIVLRSAAGYLAAPRQQEASTLSHFDRILIVPVSASTPASGPTARPAVAEPTPQRPPGFPAGFPPGRPPFAGPTGAFTPPQGANDDAPITNIVMPNRGAVFNGFQQPQLVPAPAGSAGQSPTEEPPPGQVIVPNGATAPSIPGATVDQFGGTSIPGVIVQPQQRTQQPGASSTGR